MINLRPPQHHRSQLLRKFIAIGLIAVLWVGLVSASILIKRNQDTRNQASGTTVGVVLKASKEASMQWQNSPLSINPDASLAVTVETTATNPLITAADITLNFDPNFLTFVEAKSSLTPLDISLATEVSQTTGLVRIVSGRNPSSLIADKPQLVVAVFKVKQKLGDSRITLTENSQLAAKGVQSSVLVPTTVAPYSFTVVPTNTAIPETKVQLKLSLAGTPVENKVEFLTQSARKQLVALAFQNVTTGETIVTEKVPMIFVQDSGASAGTTPPQYFTLEQPFQSKALPTGKYNILVKGPLQQQIRFCENNQVTSDRCALTQGIELTAQTDHVFDFSKRPLSCGDLPISGANRDQQDGAVRVTDYSFMLNCLTKRQDTACVARADCNGDGSVTNLDMDLLLTTLSTAYDQ